jgi:hypothetical protein
MERRGAEVVAIDCWDNPFFREAHARLGSRVDYRQIDIYRLTPDRVERFDIVLFMGVLYHLKHPLLTLECVCALTIEMAAIDSFHPSNPRRIAVDIPLTAERLRLTGVCDAKTWIKGQIDRAKGHSLSLWIAGLPENADRNNVEVYVAGRRMAATWIETRDDENPRQVNIEVPQEIAPGTTQIGVAVNCRALD